jgi:hypothetical protein
LAQGGPGVTAAPGVKLLDEGVDQGRVQSLDCTGVGIACSLVGNVGTVNVASGGSSDPGGRITLATVTPVMTTDVSNSTSIFYTFYKHDRVPIYNGTAWTQTQYTELTNTTTNATVNPAAVVADSNYDLFVWDDGGTLRLGRGPAWTSSTARGVGAGTTELIRVQGVLVNANAITNGPAAQRGTYVGTVRSDVGSVIDWELGGVAAGGDPGFLYVWNMYNRVDVEVKVTDSTAFWDYLVLAIWRASNASTSNRVSIVLGLVEDTIDAAHIRSAIGFAAGVPYIGIGFDSTTVLSGVATFTTTASFGPLQGRTNRTELGFHFYQAIELNNGLAGSTARFYGQVVVGIQEGALFVKGRF